jgi:hypothetical protein
MRPTMILQAALIAAMAVPAFAQTQPSAPPTRVRGTIEQMNDHTLTVKSRDGAPVTVTLAPDFTVRAVVAEKLADIKPGDRIGITSVKAPNGAREAIEVHIFPADLRNVRMGEFPWDLGTDSLMTNGPVAEVTAVPEGRTVKLKVNGQEREITIPTATPIVTFAPGTAALLKPGAAVFVIARKGPDGKLIAPSVTAEEGGVKPPM